MSVASKPGELRGTVEEKMAGRRRLVRLKRSARLEAPAPKEYVDPALVQAELAKLGIPPLPERDERRYDPAAAAEPTADALAEIAKTLHYRSGPPAIPLRNLEDEEPF